MLDEWFVREVQPALDGRAALVRFADDFAVLFEHKRDAQRFLAILPERFGTFGLTLHSEKTRLVPFRRPDLIRKDEAEPGTFDLLGFTHYWGVSRRGKWVVMQHTAKDRFSRTLRRFREWCRLHRHAPLKAQHLMLVKKLNGHYAYFGITSNMAAITRIRHEVPRIWRKALARRSQQWFPWSKMMRLLERYPLPPPRIVHQYSA